MFDQMDRFLLFYLFRPFILIELLWPVQFKLNALIRFANRLCFLIIQVLLR